MYEFSNKIFVNNPKAPAVESLKNQFGGKSDIFIEVSDPQTSIVSLMGFSIKSRYSKSQPTLFNASTASQFMFELSHCDVDLMNKFNAIRDDEGHRGWQQCREFLKNNKMDLEFKKTKDDDFDSNLVLVRDQMPQIMAWCVKDRLIDSDKDYEVTKTVDRLIKANPIKVKHPEIYYPKAIKDLLMSSFTGMTAKKLWNGKEQVNGGYIVVMTNGDVLCYHSTDRESFRNYLYKNTHFEYVDTKKYDWSFIKPEGDKYYLPLNVSIRFNPKI